MKTTFLGRVDQPPVVALLEDGSGEVVVKLLNRSEGLAVEFTLTAATIEEFALRVLQSLGYHLRNAELRPDLGFGPAPDSPRT